MSQSEEERKAQDYSARFKKPGDEAAPAGTPAQAAAAPPASGAPGFLQMFEDTLTAPVGLGAVFTKVAQAPAPGFGVMTANFAVFSAGFLAVSLLRSYLAFPDASTRHGPQEVALVGLIALALMTGLSFVWAGIFHGVAQAAGGRGDYQRSYQVVSLLSVFWPAFAAAGEFRYAWIAVAAIWCYLSIIAVEAIHQAPSGRTRGVFWSAAAVAVGGVWYAGVLVDRELAPYLEAAKLKARTQRQMEDMQATMGVQQNPGGSAPNQDPMVQAQALILQTQEMLKAAEAGRPPSAAQGSSLNLVSAPAYDPTKSASQNADANIQALKKNNETMKQSEINVLNSVLPMLNDPKLQQKMSPQEKAQMQAMAAMMQQLQGALVSDKPMTQDQIKQLQKMREMAMQQAMQAAQQHGQSMPTLPTQTGQQRNQQ